MSTNEFTNFIKCLDSYKGKQKTDLVDIMNIVNVVNKDYFEKKYYKSSYVGDTFIYNKKRSIQNNTNPCTNVYYSLYSDSHYDFLVKDNEQMTTLISMQPPKQTENIPKKKVEIQASVSSLQDLIDIVDNHTYSEEEEYNIDLKSLHNIKMELDQLNKMVGMKCTDGCYLEANSTGHCRWRHCRARICAAARRCKSCEQWMRAKRKGAGAQVG